VLFDLHDQLVTHQGDMASLRPDPNLPVDTTGTQPHQQNLTGLVARWTTKIGQRFNGTLQGSPSRLDRTGVRNPDWHFDPSIPMMRHVLDRRRSNRMIGDDDSTIV
jgi:hypothetical protein